MTESRQGKLSEDKQQISFVAYRSDVAILKDIAKNKGLSTSSLLNMLLREYIDTHANKG